MECLGIAATSEILSGSLKRASHRTFWQAGSAALLMPACCREPATQLTNRRQFTALPKHPYNSSRCWLIWVLGGGGTLGPPGNYRFEHSFLKRVANECGRPS